MPSLVQILWTISVLYVQTSAEYSIYPEITCLKKVVRENSNLNCECKVNGTEAAKSPEPRFYWPGHSNTSRLQLDRVRREMNGTSFTCLMDTPDGKGNITASYTLQVAYGPYDDNTTIIGPTTFVTDGSRRLNLTCSTAEAYPAPGIDWPFVTCDPSSANDACVFLPQPPEDDQKVIVCTAASPVLTDTDRLILSSAVYVLNLTYPPDQAPQISTTSTGDTLRSGSTLACTATGGKPLVSAVIFNCTNPTLLDTVDFVDDGSVASFLIVDTSEATADSMVCTCSAVWDPNPDLYLNASVAEFLLECIPRLYNGSVQPPPQLTSRGLELFLVADPLPERLDFSFRYNNTVLLEDLQDKLWGDCQRPDISRHLVVCRFQRGEVPEDFFGFYDVSIANTLGEFKFRLQIDSEDELLSAVTIGLIVGLLVVILAVIIVCYIVQKRSSSRRNLQTPLSRDVECTHHTPTSTLPPDDRERSKSVGPDDRERSKSVGPDAKIIPWSSDVYFAARPSQYPLLGQSDTSNTSAPASSTRRNSTITRPEQAKHIKPGTEVAMMYETDYVSVDISPSGKHCSKSCPETKSRTAPGESEPFQYDLKSKKGTFITKICLPNQSSIQSYDWEVGPPGYEYAQVQKVQKKCRRSSKQESDNSNLLNKNQLDVFCEEELIDDDDTMEEKMSYIYLTDEDSEISEEEKNRFQTVKTEDVESHVSRSSDNPVDLVKVHLGQLKSNEEQKHINSNSTSTPEIREMQENADKDDVDISSPENLKDQQAANEEKYILDTSKTQNNADEQGQPHSANKYYGRIKVADKENETNKPTSSDKEPCRPQPKKRKTTRLESKN